MPLVPFCGLEVLLIAVIDQGVEPIDRFDDHVAAAAAIAAAWSAELDVLLRGETPTQPLPPSPERIIDFCLVEKFHRV